MSKTLLYPFGTGKACCYAAKELSRRGLSSIDHPAPEVTHLLLDIPFSTSEEALQKLLCILPSSITIIGGMIPESVSSVFSCCDLLQDDFYLTENAALTAECALQTAASLKQFSFRNANVMLIGWGRISKILARFLDAMGANIYVFSRSVAHLAEAHILGYQPVNQDSLFQFAHIMELIYNTAPAPILSHELSDSISAIQIDLASKPGLLGSHVLHANGLPGKMVPESSGILIANAVIRHIQEART